MNTQIKNLINEPQKISLNFHKKININPIQVEKNKKKDINLDKDIDMDLNIEK